MKTKVVACLLCAAPALTAQRTWIVDGLNRAGTDFTTIPAAVAAASPWDVIRVRWIDPTLRMPYLPPRVTRALTILGEGTGVTCWGALEVQGLPAGEQVVISNLRIGTPDAYPLNWVTYGRGIAIENCAGVVLLSNCSYGDPRGGLYTDPRGFLISGCTRVLMNQCVIQQPPATITHSTVMVEWSSFLPYVPSASTGQWTIHCSNSTLWLTDSLVQGELSSISFPCGGQAMALCGSTVYLAGNTSILRGSSGCGSALVYSTLCSPPGPNAFYQDPHAIIGQSPSSLPGTLVNVPIPVQRWYTNTARTTLTTTCYGYSNQLTLLAWDLAPAAPATTPLGLLHLDPTRAFLADLGPTDANGVRVRTFAIPPGLPPDLCWAMQSAQVTPQGGVQFGQLSMPSIW